MNLKKIFDSNFDSQLKKVLSEEDYEGYTIKICELKSDRADEGRIGYAIYEGDDFLTWGSGYDNTKNALKFAKEDVDTNLLGKVEDSAKDKEVFTIMVLSDTVDVTQEMFEEQWTSYYSLDDACDAAELLAKNIAKNEPDFDGDTIVSVMGGEYETETGGVYGDPIGIISFKVSDFR